MAKYLVRLARDITFTEYIDVEVEADTRGDALDCAIDLVDGDEPEEYRWREADWAGYDSNGVYPVSIERTPDE